MTKDEFIKIVDRFNKDKKQFNYIESLKLGASCGLNKFKNKVYAFPAYYTFKNVAEFKWWVIHSEDPDFISKRFCPICGGFIDKVIPRPFIYPSACSESCLKKIRTKHSQAKLIEKYGVPTPAKDKEVLKRIKETNLRKYGVAFPLQNTDIHIKTIQEGICKDSYKKAVIKVKQTKQIIYGDSNYNNANQISKTKQERFKSDTYKRNYISRVKATKLKKYGNADYNNIEKIKQTSIEKYNVDNPAKSDIIKKKIAINAVATRKKNGTLNTSHSFEDYWYNILVKEFSEYHIERQYKEERYPYSCDFYIRELDLFIEMQGGYYHNYRAFSGNKLDIVEYERMVVSGGQKASIAKVWRYKDPKKRECAIKNRLRYIEYWEGETDLVERVRAFIVKE